MLLASLRIRGERVTEARRAVLDVVAASRQHLTAEAIFERVSAGHPGVHRATVYRTLDTLTTLGITEHSHLGHGPAVYHLADELHQHLVCEECGAIVEVPTNIFASVDRKLRASFGFVMRPTHFAIVGLCQHCAG